VQLAVDGGWSNGPTPPEASGVAACRIGLALPLRVANFALSETEASVVRVQHVHPLIERNRRSLASDIGDTRAGYTEPMSPDEVAKNEAILDWVDEMKGTNESYLTNHRHPQGV